MEREHSCGVKQRVEKKTAANMQLVKNMVNRLNTMSTLLYEMKAGTPLGKTMNVLFNLYRYEGEVSVDGSINLINIPLKTMAGLAGISEVELRDSLDFLHRNGIIIYRSVSR